MAHVKDMFAGLVAVTPERWLYVRKVSIVGSKGRGNKRTIQLVFVHGLCGTQSQFDMLLSVLSAELSSHLPSFDFDCILYDWMGCGQSHSSAKWSDYSQNETCADLQVILATQTDTSKPTVMIGHSYGPSMFLHIKSPNVIGYVFLSSAVRTPSLMHLDGGHPIFQLPVFLLQCLQSTLNRAFVKDAVHPDNTCVREMALLECKSNDMFMAKAYHSQTRWTTQQQLLNKVKKTPCLIIHGVDDKIISIAAGQELANLVQAKLHPISKASHLVMMEQPTEVAALLLDFLASILAEL